MSTILEAANLTGEKIRTVTGHAEASDAFKATHGDVVMVWNPDAVFDGEENGQRGTANCETKKFGTITCRYVAPSVANTIHEFGHVFDNHFERRPSDQIPAGKRSVKGFKCAPDASCIESKGTLDKEDREEELADFYLNWILDGAEGYDNYGLTNEYGANDMYTDIYSRQSWWGERIRPIIESVGK
jgi:hypothetical protein